jgi:hypothetical protein
LDYLEVSFVLLSIVGTSVDNISFVLLSIVGTSVDNTSFVLASHFLHAQTTTGVVLMFMTVLALILANSPLAEAYASFFHTEIAFNGVFDRYKRQRLPTQHLNHPQ